MILSSMKRLTVLRFIGGRLGGKRIRFDWFSLNVGSMDQRTLAANNTKSHINNKHISAALAALNQKVYQ
jgi:hypothetical protein